MSKYSRSITWATRNGYRGETWTGAQLVKAVALEEGGEFIAWVSFGHVYGVEKFARERLVLRGEQLVKVTDEGQVVLRRPLDRRMRILVK